MSDKFLIQTDNGPMRFRNDLIKKRREKLGLSEQQVGDRAGFPSITIKRVEAAQNVTVDTLVRVAHALEIDPSLLLKGAKVRRAAEVAVR